MSYVKRFPLLLLLHFANRHAQAPVLEKQNQTAQSLWSLGRPHVSAHADPGHGFLLNLQ